MTTSRPYSVEFFDLQLRFASKVAVVSGLPFAYAVGNYTNLYVRPAGVVPSWHLVAGRPDAVRSDGEAPPLVSPNVRARTENRRTLRYLQVQSFEQAA
jgi:hypothetical protein